MTKRFTIVLLFCFIWQNGIGQGLSLAMDDGFLWINYEDDLALEYLSADDFQELDWQAGYAYFLDGSARKYIGLKYNPAEDVMLVNTGETVLPMYPGAIDGISMETEKNVKHIFLKVPLETPVFMEVLSVGRIHLMLYRVLGEKEKAEYVKNPTIVFQKTQEFVDFLEKVYVWTPQRGVEKIKLSNKTVLALLSDYSSEVESYIDDNNLRVKDMMDAIKIFDFYNRLGNNK